MSNTLEGRTPVSIVAEHMLDDLMNGTQKYTRPKADEVKFEVQEKRGTDLKTWILFAAFCVAGLYYATELSKNKVTGFAVAAENGKSMKNSTVVFYCIESEKYYSCSTNGDGHFSTRLPSGNYRFYVKDHGKLETAKSQISVGENSGYNGHSNYRIVSFKGVK